MKDATHPYAVSRPYVICSASATIGTCSNQAALGSFNLNSANPTTVVPPTPGFTLIYSNLARVHELSFLAPMPCGTFLRLMLHYGYFVLLRDGRLIAEAFPSRQEKKGRV
jgi:hypothetical protein